MMQLTDIPLIVTAKKLPVVRGWLYVHGRYAASIEMWRIGGNKCTFTVIPDTVQFTAKMGSISHIALIYRNRETMLAHAVAGAVKDGYALFTLDRTVTFPSPEFPGLRLPSQVM